MGLTQFSFCGWHDILPTNGEDPLDFYLRLKDFLVAHLAGAGMAVGDRVNRQADTLTISLRNLLTLEWLHRIDPALPGKVQQHYKVQLMDETTALAQLVPSIAIKIKEWSAKNDTKSISVVNNPENDRTYAGDSSRIWDDCLAENGGKENIQMVDGKRQLNEKTSKDEKNIYTFVFSS